jgi:hypothetical protein
VTDEERDAVALFLAYVHDLFSASSENEQRASLARREACG